MTTSRTINVRRRLSAAVFAGVLVASLFLVATPTPASACDTTLGTPFKQVNPAPTRVRVKVTNKNCNAKLFGLDRHRWFGWEEVAYKLIYHNSTDYISKNCADLRGTYTYRAGYGNAVHWHNGPEARLTC